MKYNVISNSASVMGLMDRCKALMNNAIKETIDMSSITGFDGDTFMLMREMIELFEDACSVTIDLARQMDEQTEMLQKITNEMEELKELKKQNEEILRLLKKGKE